MHPFAFCPTYFPSGSDAVGYFESVSFLNASVTQHRQHRWTRGGSELGLASNLRERRHGSRMSPEMGWKPAGLLRDAVEAKEMEVGVIEEMLLDRPDHPVNLRRSFFAQESMHAFSRAIRRRDGALGIVAAVKRFQPPRPGKSIEVIANLEDVPSDMRTLRGSGADAALFYTDAVRYGLELPELRTAARALGKANGGTGHRFPLARHDLIIDAVQIAEAAEAGASAVNLVAAAALPELPELLNAATAMGIEAVVECHSRLEVDFALECGTTILFLNNWDRTRNLLLPGIAEKLIEAVPPFILTLGGGGLCTARDCWNLLDAGFNGVVLGKTLLQSRRKRALIDEIRSQRHFAADAFSGGFSSPLSDDTDSTSS